MNNTKYLTRKVPQGLLACALLVGNFAYAQDESSDGDDDVFELSPFTVTSAEDEGWRAENTLAGSRLNTSLKDTPAVVDVLTSELLNELGINDFSDALALSANFEQNFGDLGGSNAVINASFPGAAQGLNFQTRGQGGALARNFIPTGFRPESYTTQRIDNSSGPNAILFGIGGAGGIVNVTTKRANLNRDRSSIQFRVDEHDTFNVRFDANRVLIDEKLGFRLNLARERSKAFHEWSDSDLDGIHFTLKARPTERTEINFEFERDKRESLIVDRRTITQRINVWEGLGSQLVTPRSNIAGIPTGQYNAFRNGIRDSLGVDGITNGNRFSWVANGDESFLLNTRRYFTARSNTSRPVADETYASFSTNLSGPGGAREINRTLAALSIDQRLAEKMYLNLSLSREYGDASTHQTFLGSTGGGNTFLGADPNAIFNARTLAFNPNEVGFEVDPDDADGRFVNPNAGRFFVEGRWRRREQSSRRDYAQMTLAATIDPGDRWGEHNFVANLGYSRRDSDSAQLEHVWTGGHFSNNPSGGGNRIYLRNYVTPGDFSTYHAPDWRVIEGVEWEHPTYGILRPDFTPSNMREGISWDRNGLVAVQSFWFNRRLVTTFGLRKDEQTTRAFRSSRGTFTEDYPSGLRNPDNNSTGRQGLLTIDRDNFTEQIDEGNTKSLGGVFHINENVAVYYNTSNSFSAGNSMLTANNQALIQELDILLDKPQVDGEGSDFGLKFRWGEGRYDLTAGYFETSTINTSGTLGINERGNDDSIFRNWQGIFDNLFAPENGPQLLNFDRRNLPTQDMEVVRNLTAQYPGMFPVFVHQRDLFDSTSEGYELRFNARPVKNLRIRATYSYTDSQNDNILQRTLNMRSQLGSYLEDLQSAHPDVDVMSLMREAPEDEDAADPLTIAGHLDLVDVKINETIDLNTANFGSPPHRFNLNAGYTFSERLKGLSVNAGVNWRSSARAANYVITDPDNSSIILDQIEIESGGQTDVSIGASYRTKAKFLGNANVTYQVNVRNLNRSEAKPLVRRYGSGNTIALIAVPEGQELPEPTPFVTFLQQPRTVSATVTIDF